MRKRKQMAVIYHLLDQGQSMLDFEAMKGLLQFLEVPKMPLRYWSRVVISDVLGGKDVVEGRDGRTEGRFCLLGIRRNG
jgi:hypothetical protein